MEQQYARVGDTIVYEPLSYEVACGLAVLPAAQIEVLPEYSSTIPTGVYEHKAWRTRMFTLCEYKAKLRADGSIDPDRMAIVRRPFVTCEEMAAIAVAALWWVAP